MNSEKLVLEFIKWTIKNKFSWWESEQIWYDNSDHDGSKYTHEKVYNWFKKDLKIEDETKI